MVGLFFALPVETLVVVPALSQLCFVKVFQPGTPRFLDFFGGNGLFVWLVDWLLGRLAGRCFYSFLTSRARASPRMAIFVDCLEILSLLLVLYVLSSTAQASGLKQKGL